MDADLASGEGSIPGQSNAIIPAAVDEADVIPLPQEEPESITSATSHNPGSDTAEQLGLSLDGQTPPFPRHGIAIPTRPGLSRERSVPPQQLPPAPPPPQDAGNPTDSLSLLQLRRLVSEMPRAEPMPYAFEYSDASSLAEELEEWFSYSLEERAMVLKAQTSFAQEWGAHTGFVFSAGPANNGTGMDWTNSDAAERSQFVRQLLDGLEQTNVTVRLRKAEALVYLALGCWHETAGLPSSDTGGRPGSDKGSEKAAGSETSRPQSGKQIEWIKKNLEMIQDCGGVSQVFKNMRASCSRECGTDQADQDMPREHKESERRETWCGLTLMYLLLEIARPQDDGLQSVTIRQELRHLQPNLLAFLIEIIDRLRWDDTIGLPLTKVLLLTWKSILVSFGGLDDVERTKAIFRDATLETEDKRGQPLITASPLDYHLFRQEINSKYPAYNAPRPFFPLEPESNSILPPLKNHHSKATGNHVFGAGITSVNENGTSILHQPVHIATPAPSPPPSPAGPGGKGGKKQNYQTNQLFPFLYPPLDESSNNLGGKGTTELQDVLAGRKWEGSDIPTSILEAAELFAKRMRATRAMKQLWEERVRFMKYERGWSGTHGDDDVERLDLTSQAKSSEDNTDNEPVLDNDIQERLDAVEQFYKTSLPYLQSMVMVLLKVILANVSTLIIQANGPGATQFQENQNGGPPSRTDANGGQNGAHPDSSTSIDDLDMVRGQEILAKAVSGILILLLKWFKISHILKFEYLTQLLLDSNYMALILKLLQSQELERIVTYKSDRADLNFFSFCRSHSRQAVEDPDSDEAEEEDDDDDEAVPPPIRLRRDSNPSPSDTRERSAGSSPSSSHEFLGPPGPHPLAPPEVDELGIPTSELPAHPITTYSWRNFFSSINYLRVLQKICKGKVHRNLLLVHYKSSQFLKKCLKVPQAQLRLYTLKLFKNQVPYCGRKWRQGNMRVITAVYLHCRPELRDDWLAGAEVDAGVDESVPLEQALRALTHWHNLKRYPDSMGADEELLKSGQDFFLRELEKIGWLDQVVEEEEAWEGPLPVDGW